MRRLDVRSGPMRQEVVEAVVQDLGLVLQHIASVPGAASQLPHASIALKVGLVALGALSFKNAYINMRCILCPAYRVCSSA